MVRLGPFRMALSEQECDDAYRWLLGELRQQRADALIFEIEAVVRAGTVREEADYRSSITVRSALSARERLVEALRLVVASASVPAMLEQVANDLETQATNFRWAPDYVGEDLSVATGDGEGSLERPPAETVRAIASTADVVISLLEEIQHEGD